MARHDAEVLKTARALIAAPEAWLQGSYAGVRSSDGSVSKVEWDSQLANCWCLTGAVRKVIGADPWRPDEVMPRPLRELEDDLGHHAHAAPKTVPGSLASFNDSVTHADVLGLLDRTIARLEAA